jgi:hypothetical protein
MLDFTQGGKCRGSGISLGLWLGGLLIFTALCGPAPGANLTTTTTEAAGTDWTYAIWRTNGQGTSVSPVAGNTYTCVANGTTYGNGTSNTRIRNIAAAGVQTFPGDSLTLNTNTELRAKGGTIGEANVTLNFPGVGGKPGLILNGGVLNGGDDGMYPTTGNILVASPSYICNGASGGGGGIEPNRAFNITGVLSGSGSITILNAGTTIPQQITGANNENFSGQWIVQCGWLQASNANSLGTNSVTVDPDSSVYLTAMPNAVSQAGPAWFEPCYDLNSAGILYLTNGGVMILHQNCSFAAIYINGVALAAGTHYYAQLAASYPNNFATGGSGSVTVQPYGAPPSFPPAITTQPSSVSASAGGAAQLTVYASGSLPLSYQWQKESGSAFVNASDSGDVSGTETNTLLFTSLAASDAGSYRLIVTNSAGAATSQVVTVTVTVPVPPVVAALVPAAGSTVTNFTQLQVTFNEVVQGVQAADLLLNGNAATSVSGSGSNYLFTFTQPAAGLVDIDWWVETAITDLNGDYFNDNANWSITVVNTNAPMLASATPFPGAVLSQCTQAQVTFSLAVTGVAAADLLVNGVAATTVSGTGAGPYLFQFQQPPSGTVQFSWASGTDIRDTSTHPFVTTGAGWTVTLNPAAANAALTNIVINEFLAANVSADGLKDENGNLDSWIEIYNRGTVAVDMEGWILTDASNLSDIWTFPATNIGAGQYWVIFADGTNVAIPGQNLHTTISLSKSGGYLGLWNGDVPPRAAYQYLSYPDQFNDISYGINSTNGLSYFEVQTPGGPNSTNALSGEVNPVYFSVHHGYFSQPFQLYLTVTNSGASIIYTIDGSQPSISGNVTNGALFTGPLLIQHNTVMRAAAFAPALLPSPVTSQSFFFVEDTVRQTNNPPGYPTGYAWTPTPGEVASGTLADYKMDPVIVNDPQYTNDVRAGMTSIPTVSIMTSEDDMFGPVNGLYTHPATHHTKVAASVELIYPDGSAGIQADCGVQMQGGACREPEKTPKHSFRVDFKSGFGPKELDYQVYTNSPVESFKTLVLTAGYNYFWNYGGDSDPTDQRYRAQLVRNQFTSDLMLAAGHPSFHGQFCHLYLNGIYWGVYNLHERPDADFGASYFGGDSDNYDVIKNTSDALQLLSGDFVAWNAMLALSTTGLSANAQYLQMEQYVDIDNLIDYMIVNHWGGNDDWPGHNWYVVRPRTPGGTFKFMIWDAEQVLKSVTENVTTVNASATPAQVYIALCNNAEFRLRYADHLQALFFNNGIFYTDPNPASALWNPAYPERNVPASFYMKRITEITNAIVDESARWGTYTYYPYAETNQTRNNQWLLELNNLLGFANTPGNTADYFPNRTANVLAQYKAIGLFPSVNAPIFNQLGGYVSVGFSVLMTNPNPAGTIYYTTNGTDPRVFGTGAVSPSAAAYSSSRPPILNGNVVVQARVLDSTWSALASGSFNVATLGIPIRITELMYDPIGGSDYEFIELQNIGDVTVDMSGYSFSGVTYVFPNGTTLAPGAVMVIVNNDDPAAFASRYPGVTVAGYYAGHLSNNGQLIALLDQNGNTIDAVNYSESPPWPASAAGGGYSLQIIDPNGDPNDPANWEASPNLDGSPGVVTPVVFTSTVRLNEIMALNSGLIDNGGTSPPWIELANTGTGSASLADWSLSDSNDPQQFVFPTGTTIPAGGFLVVWCDTNTAAPGLHSGFTLSGEGESLFLYDKLTNRVDAFSYGLQLTNYSIGRAGVGATWQLNQPTPGAANIATNLGPATNNLAINEWMANSVPGGSDWIELYNESSNQPVMLTGLYLANSHELFEITSSSFIAPLGYVQLFADKNVGPDHLDFKLKAAGDSITLYDYSGAIIDSVSFTNQIQGVSEGRLPDGSPNIVSFPGTPSPDASNYVAAYSGPILNEVMARNTTAVYDNGKTPDWIEIYNPTGASFSLDGMSLGNNIYGSGQWTFPAGAAIPANGYLVVWHDSSRPASTNFTSNLNTGYNISSDGDAVCLFAPSGQLVDSVAFGAQVENLSIGRVGGAWSLLSSPTPGAANSGVASLGNVVNLRINEWMANPASGSDWFEIYNTDSLPVCLSGLFLSDEPTLTGMTNTQVPVLTYVAANGWVEYVADSHAAAGPNHVNFSLNQNGESIVLYTTNLASIDAVYYGLQTAGVSQGRLPDGGSNIISFVAPTPDDSNYLPLQNVFINEVLSRPGPPLEDAVELYNSGATDVALDGWYLSDDETNFTKYQIPVGTVLPAGGYQVFYQYEFDVSNAVPFALNPAHGGSVYLSQADALGNLTGYRALVGFGAADQNVSFGRFPTSVGADFTAMSSITFGQDNPTTLAQFRSGTGQSNSYPKVGPVVINEIMYDPLAVGGVENTTNEYIELFNMTSNSVPLYDPSATSDVWKVRGEVSYDFPGGVVMPPGGYLVLVGFDPVANPSALAEFTSTYGLGASLSIYGPYTGGPLPDSGGTLQLFKPGPPEVAPAPDAGFVPDILVDSVTYTNTAPWPVAAAGTGMSLQRNYLGLYGNEPLNWVAAAPNPGSRNLLSDTSGGGLPDDWQLQYGLNPYSSTGNNGANGDPDGDGYSNYAEYVFGTNPTNASSHLNFSVAYGSGGAVSVSFSPWMSGRAYQLQSTADLASGAWATLTNTVTVNASGNGVFTVTQPDQPNAYYRLSAQLLSQ